MPAPKFDPKPPVSKERVTALRTALQIMLPIPLGLEGASSQQKYKEWKSPLELSREVMEVTGQDNVKDADYVLSQWQETFTQSPEYEAPTFTGAPEYPVERATPTPAQLTELQAEAEEREEKRKAAIKTSETNVRTAIERKKQIYAEQLKKIHAEKEKIEKENAAINAKVEKEAPPALSKEETDAIDGLNGQIKQNPGAAVSTLKADMQKRVGKDIPEEAVELAATYIVANTIADAEPIVESAVVEKIKDKPEYKDFAEVLADSSKSNRELAQIITKRAYGENFQKTLLPDVKVEISDTPKEGFIPVSLAPLPARAIAQLNFQNKILDNPKIERPVWMRTWLETQLESVRAGGIQGAAGNYQEYLVQGYLTTFRTGPRVDAEAVGIAQKFDIASGIAQPAGIIKGLAGGALKQTTTKAVVGLISKGLGAETAGLSIVAGEVINRVLSSNFFKKAKEWSAAILGGLAGLIALPIVGLGPAIGIGLGATGVSAAFGAGLGGLTLGSIGGGIVSFLGALASAGLGAIGIPILVTLLGFPVLVAIILFIINSGAYVVPQSTIQLGYSGPGGVSIVCDTAQGASQNSAANAAACIASYLDQFHLNPLTVGLLNSSGWKSLAGVLPSPALSALEASAHVGGPIHGHLQCVGFTAATAGLAYGQAFDQRNACSYINGAPASYKYVSGTAGMASGDFFLMGSPGRCSDSSPGHIGVVISVDGALISCADANFSGPGEVRSQHGCFELSQITGYLRKK